MSRFHQTSAETEPVNETEFVPVASNVIDPNDLIMTIESNAVEAIALNETLFDIQARIRLENGPLAPFYYQEVTVSISRYSIIKLFCPHSAQLTTTLRQYLLNKLDDPKTDRDYKNCIYGVVISRASESTFTGHGYLFKHIDTTAAKICDAAFAAAAANTPIVAVPTVESRLDSNSM